MSCCKSQARTVTLELWTDWPDLNDLGSLTVTCLGHGTECQVSTNVCGHLRSTQLPCQEIPWNTVESHEDQLLWQLFPTVLSLQYLVMWAHQSRFCEPQRVPFSCFSPKGLIFFFRLHIFVFTHCCNIKSITCLFYQGDFFYQSIASMNS